MLQPVGVGHKSIADYTHLAGRPLIKEIRLLAEELKGLKVLHLSATAFGGGVSEILYTLLPLMRDVGIEAEWQVIIGREVSAKAKKWIWRCHIDLSTPHPPTIEHMVEYIREYDASVFHVDQYVPAHLNAQPIHICPPAIDPLSPKNMALS